MRAFSSLLRSDDDQPLAWHTYEDVEDALEAARAAAVLGLPFALVTVEHVGPATDPDDDGDLLSDLEDDAEGEVTTAWVLTLYPPGVELEPMGESDLDDLDDLGDDDLGDED